MFPVSYAKNTQKQTYLEAIGSTLMVYTSKTWSLAVVDPWKSGKRAMPGNSSRSKGKRSCKSRCLEQKKLENSPSKCLKHLRWDFPEFLRRKFCQTSRLSPNHPSERKHAIGTPRRRYYRSASRNVPPLVIFRPSSGQIKSDFFRHLVHKIWIHPLVFQAKPQGV